MPNSHSPPVKANYSFSSYVGTLPRRLRRQVWDDQATPSAAERVSRLLTVVLLSAAGLFWVAYNIFRLSHASPVLQSRQVATPKVPVPGLVVCGPAFDSIGCTTGPSAENRPEGKRDCSDRVKQPQDLTVQSFPELRSVFDPRWPCLVVDPRPTSSSPIADDEEPPPQDGDRFTSTISANREQKEVVQGRKPSRARKRDAVRSRTKQNETLSKRQFLPLPGPLTPFPTTEPLLFDSNNTARLTLTVHSSTRLTSDIIPHRNNSSNSPGSGPQWLLLGRFLAPLGTEEDLGSAVLAAEFDWLEAPTIDTALVSFSSFRTVKGQEQRSMNWRINSQRAPNGFVYDETLWAVIRIQATLAPGSDLVKEGGVYVVLQTQEVWSFTVLDFAAAGGGVITASIFLYIVLWGQRKLDPWGIMQRYFFRSVPIRIRTENGLQKTRTTWFSWFGRDKAETMETEVGREQGKDGGQDEMVELGSVEAVPATDPQQQLAQHIQPLPTPLPTPLLTPQSPYSFNGTIASTPDSSSTFLSSTPLVSPPEPPQKRTLFPARRLFEATPPRTTSPNHSSNALRRTASGEGETTMREEMETAIERALSSRTRRSAFEMKMVDNGEESEGEVNGSVLRRRRAKSDAFVANGKGEVEGLEVARGTMGSEAPCGVENGSMPVASNEELVVEAGSDQPILDSLAQAPLPGPRPAHLQHGAGTLIRSFDAQIHQELLEFGELLSRYYLSDVLDVRIRTTEEEDSGGR